MRRWAVIGAVLAGLLLGASSPASASRYRLGTQYAGQLMREGLLRHPEIAFQAAAIRRVRCNHRLSDIRLSCRMGWVVGDVVFFGHGTVWLTFPHDQPFWN